MRRQATKTKTPIWIPGDPEAVRPVVKGETYPVFVAAALIAFLALVLCSQKGYLLLYGDAVAHLGIARRILDSRWPGIAQLGGVWLPLPHLLMMPFVRNTQLWMTGLAGAPMSMLSYAVSVAGIWRLARRLMRLRWAAVATLFYALNPNLLYLATTAMTEALFLALFIWCVLGVMECSAALTANDPATARRRMIFTGIMVLGMVLTRYDGWIIGAAAWCVLAYAWWRSDLRVRLRGTFIIFTLLCVAGPVAWFVYNAHYEGDWLDFLRGPYSAAAIDRKTSPHGLHYQEWHHPLLALIYYLRCAQIDAAWWETGWLVMLAAATAFFRKFKSQGHAWLLWLPLPFYIYSVAYGSVPIFIPQLYPHSYYNARYGMEMLPAFAVYAAWSAESLEQWCRSATSAAPRIAARLLHPVLASLCVFNAIGMAYQTPLVLKEAQVNSTTRVAFERSIAQVLSLVPENIPVMMSVNDHIGAIQRLGRPLVTVVSENDSDSFTKARQDPAHAAAVIVAIDGDPVSAAVKAHPADLREAEVICTTGQPCAHIYESLVWGK